MFPPSTKQCEATAPSCLHFRERGHVTTAHGSALPKSRLQVEHSHRSSGVTEWLILHASLLCLGCFLMPGRQDIQFCKDLHSQQHLNYTKQVTVFCEVTGVYLMISHFIELWSAPLFKWNNVAVFPTTATVSQAAIWPLCWSEFRLCLCMYLLHLLL